MVAKARKTKLGDWINEQLKAHPEGMTVHAITALARDRHSKGTDSVSVSSALTDLELGDYVKPGPWLRTNGEPAGQSNRGACVRKWYAKEHAPS